VETFIEFIRQYGYIAVFLGSLVEGESVILTASAMAAAGHMNIYLIMLIAFSGTLIADQALYFLGRCYGHQILVKYPKLFKKSDKAFDLLKRYDVWFIIACRFIYGIRVTSSVVIGISGLPPKRYSPLNVISAIIWTLVSCLGGYWIGDTFLKFLHTMVVYQKWIFGVVGIGILALYIRKKFKHGYVDEQP
jgi:membrane protein DedA with SNARE-associated domain